MVDGLRADLDHPVWQACQRPIGYGSWQHVRADKMGQIAGQCMKLEPDFVGLKST